MTSINDIAISRSKMKNKKKKSKRSRFMSRYEDWESLETIAGQSLDDVLSSNPNKDFFSRLTKFFNTLSATN